MKRVILIIVILLAMTYTAWSQNNAQFSTLRISDLIALPSSAGGDGRLNIQHNLSSLITVNDLALDAYIRSVGSFGDLTVSGGLTRTLTGANYDLRLGGIFNNDINLAGANNSDFILTTLGRIRIQTNSTSDLELASIGNSALRLIKQAGTTGALEINQLGNTGFSLTNSTGYLDITQQSGDTDLVVTSENSGVQILSEGADLRLQTSLATGVGLPGTPSNIEFWTRRPRNSIIETVGISRKAYLDSEGDWYFENHQLKNLGEPTADQDAATKAYVDAQSSLNPDLNEVLSQGGSLSASRTVDGDASNTYDLSFENIGQYSINTDGGFNLLNGSAGLISLTQGTKSLILNQTGDFNINTGTGEDIHLDAGDDVVIETGGKLRIGDQAGKEINGLNLSSTFPTGPAGATYDWTIETAGNGVGQSNHTVAHGLNETSMRMDTNGRLRLRSTGALTMGGGTPLGDFELTSNIPDAPAGTQFGISLTGTNNLLGTADLTMTNGTNLARLRLDQAGRVVASGNFGVTLTETTGDNELRITEDAIVLEVDGGDSNLTIGAGMTFTDADGVERLAVESGGSFVLTGGVSLNGFTFPETDASNTNVIQTNGAGQLSFRDIPALSSGQVSLTATASFNVSSAGLTTYQATYQQVGSIVSVEFIITCTTVAANSNSQVRLNLPIASNLTVSGQLHGNFNEADGGILNGQVIGDVSTDRALLTFNPSSAGDQIIRGSFSYIIN